MGLSIDVHGLKLSYDTHPVLDGTEFKVEQGDLVALLGANGAGKSTLLRCISRILKPTGGQIILDGRELQKFNSKEAARLMAVVPQETTADFDFSVEDIVMMGRFPYLRRFQKENQDDYDIVQQAMEMTGVNHLADRSIATLSGGEKQRVIMARAVSQQPEVLLLDEPTANLDIGYQSMLLELASRLNREQGVTVIAAIHDINLAVHHFSRFILLSDGKVLAAGRPEEVITPENIHKSYGVPASTYRHPLHGVLQISVARERNPAFKAEGKGPAVHIIGGGEEALPVLELLDQKGCKLSIGPVSGQDSGCRFAHFHGLPVIIVPPFTSMDSEHRERHLELLRASDAVVIPPIAFGEGNLPIFEEVETVLGEGKPVYIIDLDGVEKRDYSGKAVVLMQNLVKRGAVAVNNIEELPASICADGGGELDE